MKCTETLTTSAYKRWRAVKRAQIPVVKESLNLLIDRKRPDGATFIHGARGRPLVWDLTVPDTFAMSHLPNSANKICAAADTAAGSKLTKYSRQATTRMFVPVAMETG